MKADQIQVAFTSGELSPRLLGRIDLEQYQRGAKFINNAYILPHGGLIRRPGLYFLGTPTNEEEKTRLIPFIYSRSQAYVLVFNDGKVQFMRDEAFIESSPGVRYEIASPYTEDELVDVTFAQQGNVLYLCHSSYPPKQLIRTSDTDWTLSDLTFTYYALTDRTYESEYVRFKIISGSTAFATGSKFTFTTNGSGSVTSGPTLSGTGNGTMAAVVVNEDLDVAGNWEVECVLVEQNRQEWQVKRMADSLQPVAKWSPDNYPAAVTFFQQRLWLGGTPNHPQTFWGSKAGEDLILTLGPEDGDAVSFTIAADSFDQIIHLDSGKALFVFSYGGEFTARGNALTTITPSLINTQRQTKHGATNVKPVRVGTEVLFVQRDRKKVRAVGYDSVEDSYLAPDITLLAEHITQDGIVDMTYAQDPDSIVWAISSIGDLLSLTLLRSESVVAWSGHSTGFDGRFESCCTIPTENGSDRTYFIVQRTIAEQERRYIEYLDYDTVVNGVTGGTLDSALEGISETPKDEWTGLEHLEGQIVSVVADSRVHPDLVVVDGTILLDYPASRILVGLPYTPEVQLLHPEILVSQGTTTQVKSIRAREIALLLNNTVNTSVTFVDGDGNEIRTYDIPFFRGGDPMDSPIPPFTGKKTLTGQGWTVPLNLSIKQTTPMPWSLLGVVMRLTVNSG